MCRLRHSVRWQQLGLNSSPSGATGYTWPVRPAGLSVSTMRSGGALQGGKIWRGVPQQVHALDGERVVQLACGADHTLAMTSSGDVWAWGRGQDGQLLGQLSLSVHICSVYNNYLHTKHCMLVNRTHIAHSLVSILGMLLMVLYHGVCCLFDTCLLRRY